MLKYLVNPKYGLFLLGYFFVRILLLLPYSVLMILGKGLGILGYYVARERRIIVTINTRLCFPQLTGIEQKRFVKKNFVSMGQSFFEVALAYWGSDKKLKGMFEIKGIEHLHQALAAKKGVILLSSHQMMFDLAVRLLNLSLDQPIDMLYRKHNNPFLEYLIATGRQKHCGKLLGKKDIADMLVLLAQNHVVWYAPDQNFNYHMVFVPFFGVKAATVTGTSRLARESNAQVVPFFYYRKSHQGYLLELLPALDHFPSGDDTRDTFRINQLIEEQIKKCPEQYLWAHRRFKTRPPGETLIYPKKKKPHRSDGHKEIWESENKGKAS